MEQDDILKQYTSPVVIGGVGGSGTRLIAQCLKEAGIHLGSDLNHANDNLWFTFLFKRKEILFSSEEEFRELLEIMLAGMTGASEFTRHQLGLIEDLASRGREQHNQLWLRQRAKSLLSKKTELGKDDSWGWKEPNSHVVLDRLLDELKNMKYIHVTRNGLDMAHSDNQNQLRLWGPNFINEAFDMTPYYSLKYWCSVHKRVLHIGKSMDNNFLFINFDDFCTDPEKGIRQLFEFLGLESESLIPRLVALVKPPASIGRFKRYGTEMFAGEDVAFVKSLGFDAGGG